MTLPNHGTRPATGSKFRFAIYTAALLVGLVVIRFVGEALDNNPETLARLGAQLLPLAILAVAGTITCQLRRRGVAQGLAFWIPMWIYLLIVLGFRHHEKTAPDLSRLVPPWGLLAVLCIPMVAVCGLLALFVKPRASQIAGVADPSTKRAILLPPEVPTGPPASLETAGAKLCASKDAAAGAVSLPHRDRETNAILGWFLLLVGLAGAAWLSHRIATRRTVYGWLGPEEFTLEDNLRAMGPIVLLSLYVAILGLGVIRRWRWAGIPALVLGFLILFMTLIFANK